MFQQKEFLLQTKLSKEDTYNGKMKEVLSNTETLTIPPWIVLANNIQNSTRAIPENTETLSSVGKFNTALNDIEIGSDMSVSGMISKQEEKSKRGKIPVLFIVLLLVIIFASVAVGITLSFVTSNDVMRLHVTFSVTQNNATNLDETNKGQSDGSDVYCEKIRHAINLSDWKQKFISCHSIVLRKTTDEVYFSLTLDVSVRNRKSDVEKVKSIVINVIKESSDVKLQSINRQDTTYEKGITKTNSMLNKAEEAIEENEPMVESEKTRFTPIMGSSPGTLTLESVENNNNESKRQTDMKIASLSSSSSSSSSSLSSITTTTTSVTKKQRTTPLFLARSSETYPPNNNGEDRILSSSASSSISSPTSSSISSSRTTEKTATKIETTVLKTTETTAKPGPTDPDRNSWDKLLSKIFDQGMF